MKRRPLPPLLLALLLAAAAAALLLPAPPLRAQSLEPVRGITVGGEGVVLAEPDLAQAGLGVQVIAPTVTQAVAESDARMAALVARLKGLGIADRDIQLSGYSVFPQRSFQEGRPEVITGYEVNHQIQVFIRDLSRVGAILDQAFQAGANNLFGLSFSLADPSPQRAQARARAVADARSRADELARLGGARRGDLLAIAEVAAQFPQPFGPVSALREAGGAAPSQPGPIEIRVAVQATWALSLGPLPPGP